MPAGVVGREGELEAAAQFLEELKRGPAALVFEGEPGIGKTTVWSAAVERAHPDARVLSARPVEAERHLAFAALSDLLAPVVDHVLPSLPLPQSHALAVALLREDPGPRRLDQRAVGAGTLSLLRLICTSSPVVIAIDDLQWLDRPSARVLEFALRRLGEEAVGVLACERLGSSAPLDLDRILVSGRCTRVRIAPLTVGGLHEVLKHQLGRSLSRRMLLRVADASGGNPFFALELARVLPTQPDAASTILPLPDNLRELTRERLEQLPKRSRDAALAAASVGSPTIGLVAAGLGATEAAARRALERAQEAGMVALEGNRVRFSHPLYAAAAYSLSSTAVRRRMHRRLAEVVDGIEERARQLALGADDADEALASTIEAAAEHARRRGAPEIAAELADQARALTPPEYTTERRRRSVRVAEFLFHAGELQRSRELLRGVLNDASGHERVEPLRLLGEIGYHEESLPEAIPVLEEALEHVGGDIAAEAAIQTRLAFVVHASGDFEGAKLHADRALSLAEKLADPAVLAEALAVSVMPRFLLGQGLDRETIARAVRLEDPHHPTPVALRPSLCAGYLAMFVGELSRGERILSSLRERIVEHGEDSDLPFVSSFLSWSACWRGDLELAAAYSEEALETSERTGSRSSQCYSLGFAALAAAFAGEVDLARSRAEQCLALVPRTGYELAAAWAAWALALVALPLDDPEAADSALGPVAAPFEERIPDPIVVFFLPDEIEALIALGQIERAERLLTAYEDSARRLERRWALMMAARCRALLLAGRGDLEGAGAAVDEALDLSMGVELGMEVARTRLVAGQIERRRRRKRAAARQLETALAFFENAGARLWAARAKAELDRIGLRRTAADELTETERRVAELAASGLTNREVAAQLFMSPKTVEANLARVYRKLDIRSRAELGARIGSAGRAPAQT